MRFELPSQSDSSSSSSKDQEEQDGEDDDDDGALSDSEGSLLHSLRPALPPRVQPVTSAGTTSSKKNQPPRPVYVTEPRPCSNRARTSTLNPYMDKRMKVTESRTLPHQSEGPLHPPSTIFTAPSLPSLPPPNASPPVVMVPPSTNHAHPQTSQHLSGLDHHHRNTSNLPLPTSRDLYKDAFGVPPSPARSSFMGHEYGEPHGMAQGDSHHQTNEPTNQELFVEAFGGQRNADGRRRTSSNDSVVVLLVDSDDDNCDGKLPPNYYGHDANIHQGLRRPPKSPHFNIVSRSFPTNHFRTAAATGVAQHPLGVDPDAIADFSSEDDDDEVYRPSRKVARRMANNEDVSLGGSTQRPRRTTASERQSLGTAKDTTSMDDMVGNPRGLGAGVVVGQSGLVRPSWSHPTDDRPRILRDATSRSNPMNAAPSVASRQQQQQQQQHQGGRLLHQQTLITSTLGSTATATTGGRTIDRFGTASMAQQRSTLRRQRNDIIGGSGAGAAGFSLAGTRKRRNLRESNEPMEENGGAEDPAPATRKRATSTSTRRSSSTSQRSSGKMKGRSKGSTTSNKSTGQKRRKKAGGGGRRRGRGRGGSRAGRRGSAAGGDDDIWGTHDHNQGAGGAGWLASKEFSREDPALQNIGGAEISF